MYSGTASEKKMKSQPYSGKAEESMTNTSMRNVAEKMERSGPKSKAKKK